MHTYVILHFGNFVFQYMSIREVIIRGFGGGLEGTGAPEQTRLYHVCLKLCVAFLVKMVLINT